MAEMPRAPKKCAHQSCEQRLTGRTFCPEHQPINWAKGTSRTGSAEHKAWRTDVLKRDRGSCQIKGPRCVGRATEADHIVNVARGGAEFDLRNGQAVCVPCHKAKSLAEATEGRRLNASNRT